MRWPRRSKRFALRSWGILLLGVSIAGALALATHNSTDPSFTTAAGGPPTNWLGSVGAYASDALLLLFGLGSALLLPVIGLAGLRMIRLEPSGRIGRGLLIAAIGAILFGIARQPAQRFGGIGTAERLGRRAGARRGQRRRICRRARSAIRASRARCG